jgi:hypothetical protein
MDGLPVLPVLPMLPLLPILPICGGWPRNIIAKGREYLKGVWAKCSALSWAVLAGTAW